MALMVATIAGSIGALGRYMLSGFVQNRAGETLPVGTAAVNLIGAFALGVVVGIEPGATLVTSAAVGFLGGFTTFSTWMVESVRLGIVPRPRLRALLNLALVATLGVGLAALGYHIAN